MVEDRLNERFGFDAWIESFEDDYPIDKTEVQNNARKRMEKD